MTHLYSPTKALAIAAVALMASAPRPIPAQEPGRFEPKPANAYAARQTNDNVTIGVEPYENAEKLKLAFGKVDFARLGVLPVLVVVANDTDHAIQLDRMRVQLITADRQNIEPISADDALRPGRVKVPSSNQQRLPIPGIGRKPKGPLDEGRLSAREFLAPAAVAHSEVSGFFYFRLGKGPDRIPGSKLYITGIRDARTGQEVFYFEIGLDAYARAR